MSDWLCWVESAKAAPAQGGFEATGGEPVPCPRCSVDMRFLETGAEQLHVTCGCGSVVTYFVLKSRCGGRFRARRREPGLAEWLEQARRGVLLAEQRARHAQAVETAFTRVLPEGVTLELLPAHGRDHEAYADAMRAADVEIARLILGNPATRGDEPGGDA